MSNMEAFNKIMSEIGNQLTEEAITAIKAALEAKDEPVFHKPHLDIEGPLHVVCRCPACKAQPQRTWVGLTSEEKSGQRPFGNGLLFNSAEAQVWELAVDYAEAKLKERNI